MGGRQPTVKSSAASMGWTGSCGCPQRTLCHHTITTLPWFLTDIPTNATHIVDMPLSGPVCQLGACVQRPSKPLMNQLPAVPYMWLYAGCGTMCSVTQHTCHVPMWPHAGCG